MYERDSRSRHGTDLPTASRHRRPRVPEVDAEPGLVVEDPESGFCGAVVGFEHGAVVLEDRHGKRRPFPLNPAGFLLEGRPVTLRRPPVGMAGGRGRARQPVAPAPPRRTASGSVALDDAPAQVAKASRIWVEGVHDAALVERIWGDDLRIEGVVVEPLGGIDTLVADVAEFRPGPERRLGVLVDHLAPDSKESRIVAGVASPHVLVTGHPYVDIWQAVKPDRVGIRAWPEVPRGQPWKEGVCRALGVGEPADMWRLILSKVDSFHDVETSLVNAMERLIDFVVTPAQ